MVRGPAGQLGPRVSRCGSGAAGSLHRAAQSARLVARQTGPAVGAGVPQQDGVLLHYCTGTPGTAACVRVHKNQRNDNQKSFWSIIIIIF